MAASEPPLPASSPQLKTQTSMTAIPAMKSGTITKEGHLVKNLKARHFVLLSTDTATTLKYYAKPKATAPFGDDEKGSMSLVGCELSRQSGFIIIKGSDGHELKLRFANDSEKESWVAALREHIAFTKRR